MGEHMNYEPEFAWACAWSNGSRSSRSSTMVDEKARTAAVEVAKEMVADRANHWEIADAVIEAYQQALSPGSTGEAEGLKLGSRLTVDGVEAVVVDWREWLCATAETRSKEHMDRLLADPEVRASLRRSAAGER